MQDADGVERDVDGTRLCRHRIGVRVDGVPVKRVDFRRVGHTSCGGNVLGHMVKLGERATGKEDPRSLTCEGTGDRAADRATASVDHSVLVLKRIAVTFLSSVLATVVGQALPQHGTSATSPLMIGPMCPDTVIWGHCSGNPSAQRFTIREYEIVGAVRCPRP
jgi:hypothetical protein